MIQANIATTICVPGYTTAVRPPATYTNALKIDQMKAYGLTNLTPADVEEDHLIALELGGDPRDARNLWPEPRAGPANSANKDALENLLHADVCAGRMTLAAAHQCIAIDWIACAGLEAAAPSATTATPVPTAPPQPTAVPTAQPTPIPTPAPSTAPTPAPTAAATVPPPVPFTVTITNSAWGSLAATTTPGASSTARAQYANGNYSTAAGIMATKTADAGGIVSWSYTRTSTTTKGIGTHTVTCTSGGATVSASAPFTVS